MGIAVDPLSVYKQESCQRLLPGQAGAREVERIMAVRACPKMMRCGVKH
jgi:hypothetical protein